MTLTIPAETIEAYRNTRYDIHAGNTTVSLRIGKPDIAMAALHRQYGVYCSVFITAWNPLGKSVSDDINERANIGLIQQLDAEGIAFLEGAGIGTDTHWPPEQSLLALGISKERATELCKRYDQNAAVFIGPDCIPVLILHPEASDEPALTIKASPL